ncbi:MAG: hypothetical protein JWP89_2470 [Schlesneria sp.]|nr:hypothetical protein [Schlesneria sp.]
MSVGAGLQWQTDTPIHCVGSMHQPQFNGTNGTRDRSLPSMARLTRGAMPARLDDE